MKAKSVVVGAVGAGAMVFESGALTPTGRIVGNDNDDDRARYEPHYREITRPDQIQIYESILRDPNGAVTTTEASSKAGGATTTGRGGGAM